MNNTGKDPHVSPILGMIRELDPNQRLTMLKVLFWVLFIYLQLFVFAAIAADLLIATAAIAAIVVALRKTELGQRPNFVIVNGAIVASLFWSGVQHNAPAILADGSLLAALVALELVHRRRGLIVSIALLHCVALFFSPWSMISQMKASPLIGAHVMARALAVVLAVAIAFRQRANRPDPERVEPEATPAPPPSRPLSVAEWEARNPPK